VVKPGPKPNPDQYPKEYWDESDKQPRHSPWDIKGWIKPSYYKTKSWVPVDRRRDENKLKRRLERDPNHPRFNERYGLIHWMGVRITLVGTDPHGRPCISIRKGQSEPIFIRFNTNQIEIWRAGKKIKWDEAQ
jgi:hypothetical protein